MGINLTYGVLVFLVSYGHTPVYLRYLLLKNISVVIFTSLPAHHPITQKYHSTILVVLC